MCLLSVGQISLEDLFNYGLAPVPTSLFTDTGEVRYPKGKSTSKKKLKVEVSTRTHDADVMILDGCAVLYHTVRKTTVNTGFFCTVFFRIHTKYG